MISEKNYKRDKDSLAVVSANLEDLETYKKRRESNKKIKKLSDDNEIMHEKISQVEKQSSITTETLLKIEDRLIRIEEILLKLEGIIDG